MSYDPAILPTDLPVPRDDEAADHAEQVVDWLRTLNRRDE
jgi:hypothetical protein